MFQPLKGVKVVDLSQILAGPYATYLLSLMGAEVIKIEKPGQGDWTRDLGPLKDLSARKMGLGFMTQNAGKKSVAIDLKSEAGLEIVKQIVADADVFVENFKPGVAENLGLGYAETKALNPKILYCSISAYGQTGPFAPRPAYDHIIQGMCGIMKTTGTAEGGPTKVGAPYVDYATGMNAALAIVSGLHEVRRTGTSVQLDVAMLDTALMLMASLMTQHLSSGWVPAPNGNEAWSASPSSGAFETPDGLLMLAANNDAQFARLCHALGRGDILEDTRYATSEMRAANAPSLRAELNAIFLTKTAAEWEALLAEHKVPAARVRGLDEALAEEHLHARGITRRMTVTGDVDHSVHVPSLSFLVNGQAISPQEIPRPLGADTEAVLTRLSIDPDRIRQLRDAAVIG
ncbi:Crotonobetainyl-CoA:carnitine CoA-transferase CaiB [Lutimaribacter pacificus]|uniref:Crotonobetainyl-CoA:carnitine CoA-transferase CaiB n=1 Tax=Lutimaribacter pacificus TaxID=391948 RepID=A0A1H0N8G6_9RHOB|nr:CoA transferase [Lutimaribacter pacificus]SDO88630.1 Crotonobetainyl-CoA:carnitine CoA-transferase CaiB [Lutimaribacter pacificus]SHK86155.1 Crotonobetainyl-CoA:carnitine CoA-transferase CaiB [Lutimaribacter pacificus]